MIIAQDYVLMLEKMRYKLMLKIIQENKWIKHMIKPSAQSDTAQWERKKLSL